MNLSNAPAKLFLPFANIGTRNSIPVASIVGTTPNGASLQDGFPPLTMTPKAGGGLPPRGADMNGILHALSSIDRWTAAGGGYTYDAAFATDSNVNGYPKGARILRSDGMGYWINTVDGNTVDPETTVTGSGSAAAAGWRPDVQVGQTTLTMSTSNVTLTPAQYGKAVIILSGSISSNLQLILPAINATWTIVNNCTGGYTVTAKTAAGTGVAILTGYTQTVYGDGTNVLPYAQGASGLRFSQQATGAAVRDMETRDRGVVYVTDFAGVDPTGTNDSLAGIQAAINFMATRNGGDLLFPPGTYKISNSLTITSSNIKLIGTGSDSFHDGGLGVTSSVTLLWIGSGAAPMIKIYTVQNTGNSVITGSGVQGMTLNCNAVASYGIQIVSLRKGKFEDLAIRDSVSAAIDISCYQAGQLAEATDTQFCQFSRINWRSIDSAACHNAHGIVLRSAIPLANNANTSINQFFACTGQVYYGSNLRLEDADNNVFINCAGLQINSSVNPQVDLRGSDSNHFIDASFAGQGGIKIRGIASGFALNPVRNSFWMADNSNGTQYPTVDVGCRVVYVSDLGVDEKARSSLAVLADSVGNANLAAASVTSESVRIFNGSGNHVVLDDGANRWALNINPTDGSLRMYRGSGTGNISFGGVGESVNFFSANNRFSNIGTTAAAANAYLDNAQGNLLLRSTSSVRYKTDVHPIAADTVETVVSGLQPIRYRSTAAADNHDWSWYGLIAEDVAAVDPRLVHWSYPESAYTIDDDGQKVLKADAVKVPDGVQYERLAVILLAEIQRLRKLIRD